MKMEKTGSSESLIRIYKSIRRHVPYDPNIGTHERDGRRVRVRFLIGESDFPLVHSVHIGSEVRSSAYTMDTVGCFPEGKAIRA
jgi:hypothetical protein